MPKLSQIQKGTSIRILLHGKSKAGKTWFAGTSGPRTLYVSIGHGLDTLTSKSFNSKYPLCCDIIIEPDWNDLIEIPHLYIITDLLNAYFDDQDKRELFDTVVIDDLTFFSKMALDYGLEMNQRSNKSQTLNNMASEKIKIAMPAIQDSYALQNILTWFLTKLVNSCALHNKHLIVLCHSRFNYKAPPLSSAIKEPQLASVFPYITGKDYWSPMVLPTFFSEIYYIEINDQGKRTIRTRGNNIYLAGTRYQTELKEFEDELDFPTLLNKIKG